MSAKAVRISSDGNTWHKLPGNTAAFENNADEIEDTIFGQSFESAESGLINWAVSANALFKGFAGYLAKILRTGSTTAFTDETMSLESGKIYAIDDTAKQIWDRSVGITVEDNTADVTDQVEWIDYLFGRIKFLDDYNVTGPVTVTGSYFPTVQLARGQSYSLTMQAEAIDETDYGKAQSNNGHFVFSPGLRTAALELQGVFNATENSKAALVGREEVIIEIDPAGDGKSKVRGFFKRSTVGQEGDVGALEEETLNFTLNVPQDDKLYRPISWQHASDTTLSPAVRILLDAWLNETLVHVQYLPQGAPGQTPLDGIQGQAVVTDISMAGGLSEMNEFTVDLQGSDEYTEV